MLKNKFPSPRRNIAAFIKGDEDRPCGSNTTEDRTRHRLLYAVTTSHAGLSYLNGQLGHMVAKGHDVYLICPDTISGQVKQMCQSEGASFRAIEVMRRPNPVSDMVAIVKVFSAIHELRPDTIIAGTPKMSLFALLAARLLRVPHRIYVLHGLRFEGSVGTRRELLQHVERVLVWLGTDVVAVSESVRIKLADAGITNVKVLGAGSANGVDSGRFTPPTPAERYAARTYFSLPTTLRTACFVGRLTGDKGIRTLLEFARRNPQTNLLLAGEPDPETHDDQLIIERMRAQSNITLAGHVADPTIIYAASDLLLLPTLREGLPTVVLEAAATGIPTVAMSATGTVDAIIHEYTGLLTPKGDPRAFILATEALLSDGPRLKRMGKSARDHVLAEYSSRKVWEQWELFLSKRWDQ